MDGQIRHLSTANIVLMHSFTQVMNDQRKKTVNPMHYCSTLSRTINDRKLNEGFHSLLTSTILVSSTSSCSLVSASPDAGFWHTITQDYDALSICWLSKL